jgi:CheY-like chemotaxis protein
MILLLTALITSPLPSASPGKKATGPPDIQPALSPDYLLHTTNGKILLGLVVLAVLTIIFLVILGRGHGETEELGNDEDDEDEAIQPEMTHSMEEFSTPTEIYTPHPSSLYTPPEIKAEGPERSQSYSSSSKFQIQGLPDFSPDPSYQEEPPEQKSDIPVEPFVSPPPISSFPPENRQGPSDSNLKPNPEEVVSFPSWTPKPVENSEVTDSSGIPKIFDEPAVERENGAERTVSPEETEMPVVNLDGESPFSSKFYSSENESRKEDEDKKEDEDSSFGFFASRVEEENVAPQHSEVVSSEPSMVKADKTSEEANLPISTPAAPIIEVKQISPKENSDQKCILIIEDDERIAKFYTILFTSKGYRVEHAEDGLEGVDMASELLPDLILLDVMMPKMNGLMVLQTLKANTETQDTPVVVLSNYIEPPIIQRALQLGAIEYVVKSQARPEQLSEALPFWLEGKPALH